MKDECISGSEQRAHLEDSRDGKLEWPRRTGCWHQGQAGIFGRHTQALAMGENSWTEKSGHNAHTQKSILFRMIQRGNRLEAEIPFIQQAFTEVPPMRHELVYILRKRWQTEKMWILVSWTWSPTEKKHIEQVSNVTGDMKEMCQGWR